MIGKGQRVFKRSLFPSISASPVGKGAFETTQKRAPLTGSPSWIDSARPSRCRKEAAPHQHGEASPRWSQQDVGHRKVWMMVAIPMFILFARASSKYEPVLGIAGRTRTTSRSASPPRMSRDAPQTPRTSRRKPQPHRDPSRASKWWGYQQMASSQTEWRSQMETVTPSVTASIKQKPVSEEPNVARTDAGWGCPPQDAGPQSEAGAAEAAPVASPA